MHDPAKHGFRYSAALGEWEPAPASLAVGSAHFTCLTWNVWFDDYGFEERVEGLLRELKDCDADLIALQEVRPELLRQMLERPWVRRDYTISDVEPERMGEHGLVLLSRRSPRCFRRLPLPGNMGRYALLAEMDTPGGTAVAATVHLESLRTSAAMRARQLELLFRELEPFSQVLLLGDFNFCSSWKEENSRLDPAFRDLWIERYPRSPGYTEDTRANSMRLARTGRAKQVRFDRVLLRDDSLRWSVEEMALLGRRRLGPELFVSDHFGVLARLRAETEGSASVLMLGQDHTAYDEVSVSQLGSVTAVLCVGGDRHSPSLSFKASKAEPNEDALLIKQRGSVYLLAVADAHFGIEASHRLLERLAEQEFPETRAELLELCLRIQRPHLEVSSATTLLVAIYDSASGHVLALSTGDSSLATLEQGHWIVRNDRDDSYLRLDGLSHPEGWNEVELWLRPGSLLCLHTDGVDECHYRQPATSLTPARIEQVAMTLGESAPEELAERFAHLLARAALAGVEGYPGGQDNLAILAVHHL